MKSRRAQFDQTLGGVHWPEISGNRNSDAQGVSLGLIVNVMEGGQFCKARDHQASRVGLPCRLMNDCVAEFPTLGSVLFSKTDTTHKQMKIRWGAAWRGSQKSLSSFHTRQSSSIKVRTKLIPTSPRFAHVMSTVPQ